MSDPFSKDDINFDFESFDQSQEVNHWQFVTVSLKLMVHDIQCAFENHWHEIDTTGEGVKDEDQEELYLMMKHLENVGTGWRMVMERLTDQASQETRGRLVQEKMEEIHGVPFTREPVYDEGRNIIGWGFKQVDTGEVVEGVEQWLKGQGG